MKNLLLIILLYSLSAIGQKEASQWYFGGNCGANFLNNPPSAIAVSSISAIEGCASIADAAGNLLFYTNGFLIWNKNHQLMPNTLGGHASSVQSSLIVHKSGTEYYVFTTGAFGTGSFGYSVVDMALAAGLGSVTASYTLSANVAEKLTATRHCNGADTWVLIHKNGSDAFEAYQAGPSGVSTSPVISNIGPAYTNTFSYVGSAKFSPNGSKLATSFFIETPSEIISSMELYDFNPSNGVLSNFMALSTFTGSYFYTEFSPDGSKLYSTFREPFSVNTHTMKILQWDLCATTSIAATQATLITYTSTAGRELQCGIDGKIYFDCPTTSTLPVLGCINSPNLAGAASGPSLNALYLTPGTFGGGSLPNFVTNTMRQRPVFSSSASCGNVAFTPVQACAGSGNVALSYKWLFGDAASGAANTSSLVSPSHNYSSNGTYSVSLIVNYPCYSDTTVQTITVSALPSLTVSGKSTICNKESTTLTVTGAASYTWSSGQQSNTLALNPSTTTVYTVSASNSNSCQASKTITLTVNPCTGFSETDNSSSLLSVFPNPSEGIFNVEADANTTLTVYDQFGFKQIELRVTNNPQQVDLTNLPAGVYLLQDKNKPRLKKVVLLKE